MDNQRIIKVGLVGSSDLTGIFLKGGRRLEAEAKTGDAKQSKEQRAFAHMIVKYGGVFILFHSVEEFIEKVKIEL